MNLAQQQEILNLHQRYNTTNKTSLKAKLKLCLDQSDLKMTHIAAQTGISKQTIYQLRKSYLDYIPEFHPVMLICNCLGISITDIME